MINVRIMWFSDDDEEEALRIHELVKRVLVKNGYAVSSSGIVPNRGGGGGRIFINIIRGKTGSGRRHRRSSSNRVRADNR